MLPLSCVSRPVVLPPCRLHLGFVPSPEPASGVASFSLAPVPSRASPTTMANTPHHLDQNLLFWICKGSIARGAVPETHQSHTGRGGGPIGRDRVRFQSKSEEILKPGWPVVRAPLRRRTPHQPDQLACRSFAANLYTVVLAHP